MVDMESNPHDIGVDIAQLQGDIDRLFADSDAKAFVVLNKIYEKAVQVEPVEGEES